MRFLLAFLACAALASATPAKTHLDYRREFTAAYNRQDYPAALAAVEAALLLRPDSPRYCYQLAVVEARLGHPAAALAALRRLADLGVSLPIENEEAFAALRTTPEFAAVLKSLASHRAPAGRVTPVFDLPGMAGIIEGVAFRPGTGDWFFGDVHERCVWRRAPDGHFSRFSPPGDAFFGIFQLALDEPRGLLWAATTMLPESAGYTAADQGRAALVALDLATGKLLRTCPLPADQRDHVLGDLLVTPDGTVYATDSTAPLLWRLAPGDTAPQPFLESPDFISLQGLALLPGGKKLLVSDYANGLWLVDLAARSARPVAPPPHATLLGLDGLLLAKNGTVLAVQNGVAPQRVVRLTLSPDASRVAAFNVVAAALPDLDDLTLLAATPAGPVVIAQSGWAAFADPKNPAPPHTVRVFRLPK
ncbi:MAG: tetratricopeptide repeat protein [Verrucomicrobia bacterium]|nr:tetratricopeptide repeat protein [Verrucomicrobiota bacterium]